MMEAKIDSTSTLLVENKSEEIIPDTLKLISQEVTAKRLITECTISANYFNIRLNFYEPFIEQFGISIEYCSNDENKGVFIETDSRSSVNLNISTAIFENLLISCNYFNESMTKYSNGPSCSSKMKAAVNALEMARSTNDFRYSLENYTGEELLVATAEDAEFMSVYANQVVQLDLGDAGKVEGGKWKAMKKR